MYYTFFNNNVRLLISIFKYSVPVIQRKYESGLTSSESESISESSDYHPFEDTEETTDSEDVVSSNDEKDQMKTRNQKQKFISQSHLLNTPKRVTRKNKPSIIHKDFVSRI